MGNDPEFEKAGDDSIYSRINFRKCYQRRLLSAASDMKHEAMEVCRNLKRPGKRGDHTGTRLAAKCIFYVSGGAKRRPEEGRRACTYSGNGIRGYDTGLFRIRQYSESAAICGKDRQDGIDRGSIELSGTQSCH